MERSNTGPHTGWKSGDFVRIANRPLTHFDDNSGVAFLAYLNAAIYGVEVWEVHGPRGSWEALSTQLERCYGPLTPVDVDWLLGC